MVRRSRVTIAALPILLPLAAFVCGRPESLPTADFRFVLPKENATLDPAAATSVSDGWLVQAVFEGLLAFDPATLEVKPAAATGFDRSPDGTAYTFTIDDRARWSDGAPVTAQDFEYGWLRLLDPGTASPNAGLLSVVRGARAAVEGSEAGVAIGIEARGARTFVVTLERPCAYFPQLACHFALMPIRADQVARDGEGAFLPGRLIGNGAYVPTLRRVRDRLRLVKNRSYRRADQVSLEIIDALAVDSKATALNLYLKGAADWVNALPALAMPRLRERGDLLLATNLGTNFLRMNVTREPLQDPRIRRAIDLAIDREALCRFVYRTGESPASSLVPPELPGYGPAIAQRSGGDLDRARALLADAGHPGGAGLREFELLHAADETVRAVAAAIADRLASGLGLRVRPAPQEFKVFIDSQKKLRYDVCLGNWIGDYPDPTTFLDIFLSDSSNNRTGWKDAEYDRLVGNAASALDPAERFERLAQAEARLLETGPIAPIAWRGQPNLFSSEFEGFTGNLLDLHPLDKIARRPKRE